MESEPAVGLSPKQVFTDTTKLRILCMMFNNFSVNNNKNSIFANQNTQHFQWLYEAVVISQPNLRTYDNALKPILESFASNQNSRLFCALSDLHVWYNTGMAYTILDLTAKHIHSIFRRPPYECRPYTRELTYAQRLIMIFHVCDNRTWNSLVNAYAALYRREYGVQWAEQGKFMLNLAAPFPVPFDVFNVVCEYYPQARNMWSNKFAPIPEVDEGDFDLSAAAPLAQGLGGMAHPNMLRRRAMSAAVHGNAARALSLAAAGKSRSMSINDTATGELSALLGATSAAYSSNRAYASVANWINSVSAPAPSSSAGFDLSSLIPLTAGPQQLAQTYNAQAANTLVPMTTSSGSTAETPTATAFQQMSQPHLKSASAFKYPNSLGLLPFSNPMPLATPSNSADRNSIGTSEALSALAHMPATAPKSEPQSEFAFNLFMNSPRN
ncbi:hypothetical protein IWW54_004762 [Coemansia sp. RSA 2705]|nr:hypothetical protein IWW54_004762 [Coemansia sp. RSA 2705]